MTANPAFAAASYAPVSPITVVRVLISCGRDVEALRNTASTALVHLNHMLDSELRSDLLLREWDFRLDTPRDVEKGHLPDRSIEMVDRSDAVLAILRGRVPTITRLEIRRAFELRSRGIYKPVWLFMDPARNALPHHALLEGIKQDYGREVAWTPYSSRLDFQAKVLMTIVPYLIARSGTAFGPSGSTAGV